MSTAPLPSDSPSTGTSTNTFESQHRYQRIPWRALGVGLLFLAATLLAYFPVLNGQFVWDDRSLVLDNRFIRSPLMLGEIFTHQLHLGSANSYYRPIQNVSFLLDYFIWGENPFGFHLGNLLLQARCGWLLYQLLLRLLPVLLEKPAGGGTHRTKLIALLLALVWTIHPIHNAAVAYISGRADPLSFAFSAAAVCIAHSCRRWTGTWKQPTAIICSWLLGLIALCSRESAACWVMLAVIYLCLFERNQSRRACIATILSLLALLGSWLLLRQLPSPLPGGPAPYVPTGADRVSLIFRALGDYAGLLLAPITLTMERRVWPELVRVSVTWSNFPQHFGWLGCLGLLVLIIVIAGASWRGKGQRLRALGALWFGLCFLPISNLFPLNAQVAEHWMYLASVGAMLFATGVAIVLPEKWLRITASVVAFGVLPLFLLRTNLRSGDWTDPIRFYTQTIRATGGNARMVNNLASSYQLKGDQAQAERIFREGLKRYPTYALMLSNYGRLLVSQGRKEEAEALLEKARNSAKTQIHLGLNEWRANSVTARLRLDEGKYDQALALLKSAREEAPDNWEVMQIFCEAVEKVEGPDAAISALEQFSRRRWWYQEPRLLLARKWLAKKEPEKALVELRHAARLDVWDAQPYAEIAALELERRNLLEALRAQRTAVRRAPHNPKLRAALAYILHELGRDEEALVELQKFKNLK